MLKIDNLGFGFRRRSLFSGLSVAVRAGEMLHVTGSNGAGKSTLIAIIAGLIAPQRGTVDFLPTGAEPAAVDRRLFLEYLPAEANGLYLKMSAVQNLAFWAALRGRPCSDATIHTALEVWGLNKPLLRDDFAVEKFSTGMKRRLALARLSLSPAPCWLLDEPFYGLDQEAIAIFRRQLGEHLARGGSGMIVSHETTPLTGLVTSSLTLSQEEPR